MRKKNQLSQQFVQLKHNTSASFQSLDEIELPPDVAPLPSNYLRFKHKLKGNRMRHWVECELELRVGIGHDILGQLRHAIGLHHYLMRKGKKSRGLKQSIGVSKQQSNAAINKGKLISKYIKNWNRLNGLITSGVIPQRGGQNKS